LLYAPVPVVKGRGAVWALEHRFTQQARHFIDEGRGILARAAAEDAASSPGT
jgi:hypothetical protein